MKNVIFKELTMDFYSETFDDKELKDVETDEESGDAEQVHSAAIHGDVPGLIAAINSDPSLLEQQNSEGLTPLALAVQSQQMASTKQLVMIGANINAQDNFGRTCLSVAAYQGWHEGVMFLLRNGAKNNSTDKSGRTPLHASTYCVDTSIVGTSMSKSLIRQLPSTYLRTMEVLLQNMTTEEVNTTDHEKMNALHWASFHSRPEHVRVLLMRGANVSARDIDGKNPLHWAAQNGSISCCRALLQAPNVIELINAADHTGKSPVHFAAAAGHTDLIVALAEYIGCDLEIQDPDQRTPLHWAAAMGHHECVSRLLKLGVSPSPFDAEGGTPHEYACQSGHMECVKILEEVVECRNLLTNPIGVDDQTFSSKPSRGPLGIIKDFFHGCQREGNIGLSVKDETKKNKDVLEKGKKKNRVKDIDQRALSSSIMPCPQASDVKSSKLAVLPDSHKTVFDSKTVLLADWMSPTSSSSLQGSSNLVKEYPPRLPPLSPLFPLTVNVSPPARSHELAPLKQNRSPGIFLLADEACSDTGAAVELIGMKSLGQISKNLSPLEVTGPDNILKSHSKHKVKKKQSPCDSLSSDTTCGRYVEKSTRRQSLLDQSAKQVGQEKTLEVNKSTKFNPASQVQETSTINKVSATPEAVTEVEVCDKYSPAMEQARHQNIFPKTLSPRSRQSIAVCPIDGRTSHSIQIDPGTISQISEERRNLDKSIYNLLQ